MGGYDGPKQLHREADEVKGRGEHGWLWQKFKPNEIYVDPFIFFKMKLCSSDRAITYPVRVSCRLFILDLKPSGQTRADQYAHSKVYSEGSNRQDIRA